ncbi:MAG: hypothetical protein Satyrvirus7_19 [Satyrvirus sp.]|uniref:Uncharacterized protein n=1 Tax=Satyrvirus sp. TaxID=2487771 RepID=A0A3G5ADC4_9VIRU|nr:MAG: hypothetical protein Satyrvirus7_19 [Satyrvirus sp.]
MAEDIIINIENLFILFGKVDFCLAKKMITEIKNIAKIITLKTALPIIRFFSDSIFILYTNKN